MWLLPGACQALQPGLEYQYRYSARVASGIPSINRQFAAAGIQADVTVQMAADYSVVVQVSMNLTFLLFRDKEAITIISLDNKRALAFCSIDLHKDDCSEIRNHFQTIK